MKYLFFLSLLVLATATTAWAQRPVIQNGAGNPNAGQGGAFSRDTASFTAMDSGRSIYGAYTTKFFLEADWLEERRAQNMVDTILLAFHRYQHTTKSGHTMQDLSAIASPAANIYYEQPQQIGIRLGMDALQHLVPNAQNMLFFDTKSPYTNWEYVQGGGGRSLLDISFARNITPRSNIGLGYQRSISKQLVGTAEDASLPRQTDFQNMRLQANYESKSGKYRVLGFFSGYRHLLTETGGLLYNDTLSTALNDLFLQDEGLWRNRLATASGTQKANIFHIYQEYRPFGADSSALSLFQQIDWVNQTNTYTDTKLNDESGIYPDYYFDDQASAHGIRLQQLDVRTGAKFRYKGLFIASYFRLRGARAAHEVQGGLFQLPYKLPVQNIIGAIGSFHWEKVGMLRFSAEHVLGKDYKLDGLLDSKWLDVSFKQMFYSPSLLEQRYYGNHFRWNNNFSNTLATEIGGTLKLGNKHWQLKPQAKLGNVLNLIYFGEEAQPVQANKAVSFLQAGLEGKFAWKVWHFAASGRYAQSTDDRQLPMPRLHGNLLAYYESIWIDGILPIQIGVDMHWHTAYYANMYMPITQQFYRQQRYKVGNYPLADIFVAGTVRTVRLFVKFTNLLQGFPQAGYYLTPGYMAQPRQFEFGLNWKFYD